MKRPLRSAYRYGLRLGGDCVESVEMFQGEDCLKMHRDSFKPILLCDLVGIIIQRRVEDVEP